MYKKPNIKDKTASSRSDSPSTYPHRLRCERLETPLAIEYPAPRLSWEIQDSRRGAIQIAYQILVASAKDKLHEKSADFWNSGKVISDQTLDIEYMGKPLEGGNRYFWMVRSWDADDVASHWSEPATWGMGLLKTEEWKAKWIGDANPPPTDSPPHLGYRSLPDETGNAPKWVAIDLGSEKSFNGIRLFGTRLVDYQKTGDVLGYLYPLRYCLEVANKKDFSDVKVVRHLDSADIPNPGVQPVTWRFKRITARFVRILVGAFRKDENGKYAFALAEMEVLSDEENVARSAAVFAFDSDESSHWSTSKLTDGDIYWHHGGPVTPLTPPIMRKEFELTDVPNRAVIFATALGLYELRINGQRVGDQELAPEWTDYNKFVQYQAYDVSPLLRPGANVIAVQLADGWYAGRIGMTHDFGVKRLRGVYGRVPHFLIQLQADFIDGSVKTIVSDETWKSTLNGPLISADLYDGEHYDARRELSGWDCPGFDDSAWKPVIVDDSINIKIYAQPNEPIRVTQEIEVRSVRRQGTGQYIFDLGQNMVGRVRMRVKGKKGSVVRIRHAEALDTDGGIYTAMLRGAYQIDTYTLRGDPKGEVFEPRFTQHGFRYVEVSGLNYTPSRKDLSGRVFHSAVEETGSFKSSSKLVNKISENIVWTQRGNCMGIVTDVPQRDERLGWTSSLQRFATGASFNMAISSCLRKSTRDIRQDDFPAVMPDVLFNGLLWGWTDSCVRVPWCGYVHFDDRRLLEENYAAGCKFIDSIRGKYPELITEPSLGDWLDGNRIELPGYPAKENAPHATPHIFRSLIPNELFGTAFFAHSVESLSKMAQALGHTDEAKQYADLAVAIKKAFQDKFLNEQGKLAGDSQGSYALSLQFGLLPEKHIPQAVKHLTECVRNYGDRISTGVMTTDMLFLQLSRNGENDVAYRLFEGSQCPSFGYMIAQGATTIWERWDAYVPGRQYVGNAERKGEKIQLPLAEGFQTNSMNAFNHVEHTSINAWIYRVILGIEPDENNPGYKHFFIRPMPGGSLTHAGGSVHSVRGLIAVDWKRNGKLFFLNVTVPPNTRATIYVPASRADEIKENGDVPAKSAGLNFLRMEKDAAVYSALAGIYRFQSRLSEKIKLKKYKQRSKPMTTSKTFIHTLLFIFLIILVLTTPLLITQGEIS